MYGESDSGHWPGDALDLGATMRELRLSHDPPLSLRTLERSLRRAGCPVSRSTLSRYENGSLPPTSLGRVLDTAYGAGGYLARLIALLNTRRARTDRGPLLRRHIHSWPPDYQGQVWIRVIPGVSGLEQLGTLVLTWGHWSQVITGRLPPDGTTFTTDKAADRDGIAATMAISCESPVFVSFGDGAPPDGDVVDIRDAWHRH